MERENSERPFENQPLPEKHKLDREAIRQFLAKKLKEFLDKENREGKMPKIEFNFYFSGHTVSKDLEAMDTMFTESDIYFPEFVGWDQKLVAQLRALSDGKLSPGEVDMGLDPFSEAILGKIYNSKKAIGIADLPKGHKIIKDTIGKEVGGFQFLSAIDTQIKSAAKAGASRIQQSQIASEHVSYMTSLREEYVISQLKNRLQEIFKYYPKLKKKDRVGALFSIGAGHTGLYHTFKRAGLETSREFSGKPYVYNYKNQAYRQVFLGKERNLDEEVIGRGYFEQWLNTELPKINSWQGWRGDRGTIIIRYLNDQLSHQELTELAGDPVPGNYLLKAFRDKGIILPKTDEQAGAFIRKHLPNINFR